MMPCFFCIAIGAAVASGLAATTFDALSEALGTLAQRGVRLTDDTGATRRYELEVAVPHLDGPRAKPGKAPDSVAVAVTVYKKHGRARLQVLTHDVDKREAEAVQDALAAALSLTIVHRATDREQHVVHDAAQALAAGQPVSDLIATTGSAERKRTT